MAPLKLNLSSSSTYCINTECHENGDMPALSGHVTLSDSSGSKLANVREVDIRLVQSIACEAPSERAPRKFILNPNTLPCPSLRSTTRKPTERPYVHQQIVREIRLSIPSMDEREMCSKLHFALDVPVNTPATTYTHLGSITYAIEVAANLSHHDSITHRQPIKIYRHMVQRDLEMTRRSVYFPNSSAIQGMSLSQNPTPRSGPRFSFTANIHPRWETARGDRPTELKHFVVREIKWCAEEIVKIMAKPSGHAEGTYSICERQMSRKLCDGSTKRYWGFERNPFVKEPHQHIIQGDGGGLSIIRIPFEFNIPNRAMLVDDIDLNAYEFRDGNKADTSQHGLYTTYRSSSSGDMVRVITVYHQLKVQVVTGEDTFHTRTGKLVERKRLRTTVCPAFPLSVCQIST